MTKRLIIGALIFVIIGITGLILFKNFSFSGDDENLSWKTYENDQYGFSIQYPPNFDVNVSESSTDFEKSFLALDMGAPDYIRQLNDLNLSEGSGGLPLYLRIVASLPINDDNGESPCETPSETVIIDGVSVIQCETLLFDSFPGIGLNFTWNGAHFSIESNRYDGTDKILIDEIISTFRFIQE